MRIVIPTACEGVRRYRGNVVRRPDEQVGRTCRTSVCQGSGMQRNTTRLKALLARRSATLMPGAPNAMFARLIEDLGFESVYVTGAGIANMYLGVPDIGLTTLTEIAGHIAPIAD